MVLNNLFLLNIINSGISLIMGFYMFFLQRNNLKLGIGYWATGSLVIGVGLFFKAIPPVDSAFATAAFPIFITTGLYLYLAGIWKFKERKIYRWLIIGIPVLDALQSITFYALDYPRIKIGFHIFFLIGYCFIAIFEMIRLNADQKYLKKVFYLNAFSFSIFLVLLLLNLYAVISFNTVPTQVSNTVIITNIISGFVMISLTFGFLSAVNIHLNMELKAQVESKTKLLSIIGHDLRGPVGNIISFLNLLQDENDLSEKERKKYLKVLNTLSQSTFHLLQNLLEWTTQSKNLKKSAFDRIELSQLIAGNIDFFKSSTAFKSIHLEFNEKKQSYISGNKNMIQTIVRNLVSNAIKFTPVGGTITISLEQAHPYIRLIVADTGQGIKQEAINALFKFETNKSTKGTNGETGSGLGLVLCKELVNNNNGTIKIESNEGVGTKVIVAFPMVA